MPKPILTLKDLSFPLATSDLGSEALENEFMMNNMHLFEVCSSNLFKSFMVIVLLTSSQLFL